MRRRCDFRVVKSLLNSDVACQMSAVRERFEQRASRKRCLLESLDLEAFTVYPLECFGTVGLAVCVGPRSIGAVPQKTSSTTNCANATSRIVIRDGQPEPRYRGSTSQNILLGPPPNAMLIQPQARSSSWIIDCRIVEPCATGHGRRCGQARQGTIGYRIIIPKRVITFNYRLRLRLGNLERRMKLVVPSYHGS